MCMKAKDWNNLSDWDKFQMTKERSQKSRGVLLDLYGNPVLDLNGNPVQCGRIFYVKNNII